MAKERKQKQEALNTGHYHEALDRVYCTQNYIEYILQNHAAIMQTPAWKKKIEQVQDILGALYQSIGQKK